MVLFKYTSLQLLGGKAATGFVERCVSYIGENAAECVRTNSFLSLPKEAVIKLISSDYVRITRYFYIAKANSLCVSLTALSRRGRCMESCS